MMTYLFTEAEDPSRKIILYGARIALALEYKGQDQSQLILCEDMNKAIIKDLSSRVEKSFAHGLCDRLGVNAGFATTFLNAKDEAKTDEEKAEEKEVFEFLEFLRIKTYTDEFTPYQESKIPLILFSRLSKKTELTKFI